MSATTGTLQIKNSEFCYPSLASMRTAHSELLKRSREANKSADLLFQVKDFIERGRATGALLDTDDDRWTGQSLIDYWVTALYRDGHQVDDATIAEFDPLLAPELGDKQCPYLGLDAFREDQKQLFFGRTRLIQELLNRLKETRLLAIIGPSGSGKSSLALGGLLSALEAGALSDSQEWHYFQPMVPGSDPLANLARLILPSGGYTAEPFRNLVESFRQQPEQLSRLCEKFSDFPSVVVVDQFEEVFTLCDDAQTRQSFIDNLLKLIESPAPRHIVILTMRSDYESQLARLPLLQVLFEQSLVRITPMSASELREAIEKPAEMIGLKFEDGVVDALLQDITGEPAALPLLQFTLLKLWEGRKRNRITLDAYRRMGGGRKALSFSADAFYNSLIPEEQQTAKRILLRMVRPSEGLEITSNRIRRETLFKNGEDAGRVKRVLDKLISARLVRLTESDKGDAQVEVAHEALIRNWPTLVQWLEEARSEITKRRRLEAKAMEWARLGKGGSGLLDQVQLLETEHWLASDEAKEMGYDALLPELVQASSVAIEATKRAQEATRLHELEQARKLAWAIERQRKIEEQAAKRFRFLAAALAVATLVALAAMVFALKKKGEAEKATSLAQDRAVLAQKEIEAGGYRDERKYADAEKLYQEVLKINEEIYEINSPLLVPSLNNLARVYQAQEKYEDAETIYRRILSINEKKYGPNSSDLIASLDNLATVSKEFFMTLRVTLKP